MNQKNSYKQLVTISSEQVKNALDELTGTYISDPLYIGNGSLRPHENNASVELDDAETDQLLGLNQFRNQYPGVDGSGFSVVVIDSGIDLNHPMFGSDKNGDGIADRIVYQYDFGGEDGNASDFNGHGSNVASIAAGSPKTYGAVTYTGIAPGANIIALKAFTDLGIGSFAFIEKALQWVVANAAKYNIASVNMSLSDGQNWKIKAPRNGIGDELSALKDLNVIAVSSSGNSFPAFGSTYGVAYPSSDPNSLSIGATYDTSSGNWIYGPTVQAFSTRADQITPFSQRHPTLTTVFAPGAPITGANANGGLSTMQGTSQAAPVVTGIIALAQQLAVKRLGRRLTFAEISNLLQSTGKTIYDGDDEDDNVKHPSPPQAYKRVDVLSLAKAINQMPIPNAVIYSLSPTATSVVEKDFGTNTLDFVISRSGGINTASSVNYTIGGTATANSDYSLKTIGGKNVVVSNNTIYFAPSSTSATLTFNILGDIIDEPNENIVINLSQAVATSGATIASASAQTIITNDDLPSFYVEDISINEDTNSLTTANFLVRLSKAPSVITKINYATKSITATASSDYLETSGTLTFSPGQTNKTISVFVLADKIVESNETFQLSLSGQNRGTIAQGTAVATISDTSSLTSDYTIVPVASTITEGGTGTSQWLNFIINRTGVTNRRGFIRYNFGGSATKNVDYQPLGVNLGGVTTSGATIRFAPGVTTATLSLRVKGDFTYESDESIQVSISNPGVSNTTIIKPLATTLINNDEPLPTVLVQNATITEGNTKITKANFQVRLTGQSSMPISVNFTTVNGSAVSGSDYTATSGSITFAPLETLKTVTVDIKGDSNFENFEAFSLILNNPTGANLGKSGTGIIMNDDLSLIGTDKPDILIGNWQDNILVGGKGADTLTGGFGADQFVYNTPDETGDLLTDFNPKKDKIVVNKLLAQQGYTGSNPIADGVVRLASSHKNTLVLIDPDGQKGPLNPVPLLTVEHLSVATLSNVDNFVF